MKIGLEIELFANHIHYMVHPDIIDKWGLVPEFYSFQIEFNKFLEDVNSKEDIEKVRKKIVSIITELSKDLKEKNKIDDLIVSEFPVYFSDTRAFVFNGIHLHLSFEDNHIPINFLRKYVVAKKVNDTVLDMRFILSHHLWGGIRDSNYSFKKRPKFRPAIITDRGTMEIRCLSLEDILNEKFFGNLIEDIWDIVYNTEQIKRTATEYLEYLEEENWRFLRLLYHSFGDFIIDENFKNFIEEFEDKINFKLTDFNENNYRIEFPVYTINEGKLDKFYTQIFLHKYIEEVV